jgi:hypothetical protein
MAKSGTFQCERCGEKGTNNKFGDVYPTAVERRHAFISSMQARVCWPTWDKDNHVIRFELVSADTKRRYAIDNSGNITQ